MPLLDHFHPPLHPRRHWESFHATWSVCLADTLNERWLPEKYFAEVQTHANARVEIDVATYEETSSSTGAPFDGSTITTLVTQAWSPPPATSTLPAVFPDTFEVRVFSADSGSALVAAIELISPRNKDRPEARRTFAINCANNLAQGISLILMDIVTNRQANLHNEIIRLMEAAEAYLYPEATSLYAVAYRPVLRLDREEIDLWPVTLAVGDTLPVLPLRLKGDLFVPIDFEATYIDAARRQRLR
jgi:hypothetical protein